MADASPNISEIASTTIKNYSATLADNVSNGNALLSRLNERGTQTADGGETILQNLMYAENATFQWYSGYDKLDVAASDVISSAEYQWKQAAVNVTWNGLEMRVKNAGREKIHDLLESRIQVAEITMRNNISEGIYSDGTGNSGKEITGLLSQVALDPTTGTVGGINRVDFSFWRNNTSGDVAGIDTSSALLDAEMRDMWTECTRGADMPDLIVADQTLHNVFWSGLQDIQRVTSSTEAVKGFQSLKFHAADVVFENSAGQHASGIRANTMYFLNSTNIHWRPHVDTNMVAMDRIGAINQDATVQPIIFAGNLTMSNASLQGVVFT